MPRQQQDDIFSDNDDIVTMVPPLKNAEKVLIDKLLEKLSLILGIVTKFLQFSAYSFLCDRWNLIYQLFVLYFVKEMYGTILKKSPINQNMNCFPNEGLHILVRLAGILKLQIQRRLIDDTLHFKRIKIY